LEPLNLVKVVLALLAVQAAAAYLAVEAWPMRGLQSGSGGWRENINRLPTPL